MKGWLQCLLFLLITTQVFSQSSQRIVDSLQQRIANSKDPHQRLPEQARLAVQYFTAGDQKKAYELLSETEKESKQIHSKAGLAGVLHARGTLCYYTSQFDSALVFFDEALSLRRQIDDRPGILKTLSNMGGIHYMLVNNAKALTYYEEVLRKEAEWGFREGEHLPINNIGAIYYSLGMPSKALVYFRKADRVYSQRQETSHLIMTYDGYHNCYKYQKMYDSAIYYAHKTRKLSEDLGEELSVGYALHNIGACYLSMKKYDQAIPYIRQALLKAQEQKDKRLQLSCYGNFAGIYLETGKPDSTSYYVEKVMALEKELQLEVNSDDLYKLYAAYYAQKNDFKNAYNYMYKYSNLHDSLYNIQANGQVNEMQEKYQSEKKEKENLLLSSENELHKKTQNFLLLLLIAAVLVVGGTVLAYSKIRKTNRMLGEQKQIVTEKQKEILDSIAYARRIQFALLGSNAVFNEHLGEHFVLFMPKDVVSGDFYWGAAVDEGFLYLTADCTGHGVPGAFMSLLNISKANQIVKERQVTRPDLVLNELRKEIIQALNPGEQSEETKDGMDAVLCKLDLKNKKLEYAAANNSFYLVRDGELIICKADKMPVGKGHDDSIPFTLHRQDLKTGDLVYTFTDGLADQFGGPFGKKYKYKQFETLLLSISALSMQEQKRRIEDSFLKWKRDLEQVDDICVIGIRIS